ncbi:DDE-type integrase/transposase/recombinase [Zhongshania sp.]|uniref:DDE-type integrase/transposase/recombinase n=1 Tax=Zhongshania sp. TaxID=1971902 RepID=UPI001B4B000C|nr:DDE-type integrase/transposase/recombinase [Zhongshania sp.]MBQ0796248.1 transposase family protein [Zhongshania sp.]
MPEFAFEELRYLEDVAARLHSSGHGSKQRIVENAANFLSCSINRVYQGLKAVGYQTNRKKRSDRGLIMVTEEECLALAGIMMAPTRNNGKELPSLEDALEIAVSNGLVTAQASPSTWSRGMEKYGCHPKQLREPSPHQTMRSLYSNHVWQVDASICVLYYLKKGGLRVMDEKTFNKNKPKNVARIADYRLIRYVATDHRSGAIFVNYYQSAGENQEILFRFLVDAFTKRDHPCDPFHGVPTMIYWDKGSANTSSTVKTFLDRLDVRHEAHAAGNARATGQVENANGIVEKKFEFRLSFAEFSSVDEINKHAHAWMRDFNATAKHSRTGETRFAIWQKTPAEKIRKCPPRLVCQELRTTKPVERTVKGLCVQFAVSGFPSAKYSVSEIPSVREGEKVLVCVNPYRAPDIYVLREDEDGNTIHYACAPIELDDAGFPLDGPVFGVNYFQHEDTDVDKQHKKILQKSYGVNTRLEAQKARSKGAVAFNGKIDAFKAINERELPIYLPRAGVEIEVPNPAQVVERPVTPIQIIKQIRGRLGRPLTSDENQLIREACPSPVAQEELEALLTRLHERISGSSGPKTPVAGLRGI